MTTTFSTAALRRHNVPTPWRHALPSPDRADLLPVIWGIDFDPHVSEKEAISSRVTFGPSIVVTWPIGKALISLIFIDWQSRDVFRISVCRFTKTHPYSCQSIFCIQGAFFLCIYSGLEPIRRKHIRRSCITDDDFMENRQTHDTETRFSTGILTWSRHRSAVCNDFRATLSIWSKACRWIRDWSRFVCIPDVKLRCRSSAQFIVAEDATARRIEPVLRARGHRVSLHRLNELLPRNHIPALAYFLLFSIILVVVISIWLYMASLLILFYSSYCKIYIKTWHLSLKNILNI